MVAREIKKETAGKDDTFLSYSKIVLFVENITIKCLKIY